MKKYAIVISAVFLLIVQAGAQSIFKDGETLLSNNQLSESALLFEEVIEQEPKNEKAYLYLGYIYEIKMDYNSAISVLTKGLENTSGSKDKFYFNIANNYFKAGDYDTAAAMYSKALQNSRGFAEPYLNRANCRVKTGEYSLAVRDYNLFLNMKPNDPQRPEIEKMISMLELTMAEEETLRQQEEQRRLAQEARQKALLDSVLNSLSNAGEDTTNLSAESENIEDIEIELGIED